MNTWKITVTEIGDDGKDRQRNQYWKIVESVHVNGKVMLNLTRKGKARTIRVR
jgi:hypothetical protein